MSDHNQDSKGANLVKLFQDAKSFTEELLKENERLRMANAGLRNEIHDMEGKYIKVDVPRLQERVTLLESENRALREELREIKKQFNLVERENIEYSERYVQVEQQNSNLINLYVASYRLHSTLNFPEVLQIIKEIVINMIGSEHFEIYMVDDLGQRLIEVEQMGPRQGREKVMPITAGPIQDTIRNAVPFVATDSSPHDENRQTPVACIPMKANDKVLGVIVIRSLLIQKEGFKPVDYELFELLGIHATTACYGSHLFSLAEKAGTLMNGFVERALQGAA